MGSFTLHINVSFCPFYLVSSKEAILFGLSLLRWLLIISFCFPLLRDSAALSSPFSWLLSFALCCALFFGSSTLVCTLLHISSLILLFAAVGFGLLLAWRRFCFIVLFVVWGWTLRLLCHLLLLRLLLAG